MGNLQYTELTGFWKAMGKTDKVPKAVTNDKSDFRGVTRSSKRWYI